MKNLWKRILSLVMAIVMVIGMVPTSVFAAHADSPLAEADGILWLYDDNGGVSEEFETLLTNSDDNGYRLDNLIRRALAEDGIDENDDTIKVKYEGTNVGNWEISKLLLDPDGAFENEIKTSLSERKLICFNVGGKDKYIAIRRIQDVVISDTIVIDNPENVDAQIDAIFANPNGYITISNKGDVANLEKTRHEFDPDSFVKKSDYHWPTAAENKAGVVAGTFTVIVKGDDKGDKTQEVKIVLRDSRKVLTNSYDFQKPDLVDEPVYDSSYHYYEDEPAPEAPALPTDEYYVCDTWVEVSDGVYKPNWTVKPEYDQADGGDDIADAYQSFNVYYYDSQPGDSAGPKETHPVLYGNATPNAGFVPSSNPDPSNRSFGGWVDENGKAPSATVTGTAKYYPVWTENPVVTYNVYDRNMKEIVDFQVFPAYKKDGKWYAQDITNFFTPDDGYYWTAWRVYDEEETWPLVSFANTSFDSSVELFCQQYPDVNDSGAPDGTAEDPYYTYKYYVIVNGNEVLRWTKENVVAKDDVYVDSFAKEFNPKTVEYPADVLRPGEEFKEWTLTEVETSTVAGITTKTYKCTPVIERVAEDAVTVDGLTGAKYELVESGKLKVTYGEYIGWVKVNGLLYDEEYDSIIINADSVESIEVTPLWKNGDDRTGEMSHYVASVVLNEQEIVGSYEKYNFVYNAAPESAVALAEGGKSLSIRYEEVVEITQRTDGANALAPGKEQYTAEEVYNAAVASPAYSDNITVEYQARPACTLSVKTSDFKALLEKKVVVGGEELSGLLDQIPEVYEVPVTERYVTVTVTLGENQTPVFNRTVDEIVSEYFVEVMDDIIQPNGGIDENLSLPSILNGLKECLENEAELHKFGQILPDSTSVVETLKITYDDKVQYVQNGVEVTIVDSRSTTPIISFVDSTMEVVYGDFSTEDLLANVLVNGATVDESDLKLDTNYELKDAGKYAVTVTFQGNEALRGATGTFELTIHKVNPSIDVEELITVMYEEPYNPAPTVAPDGMNYVHVVAGVAVGELAIDSSALKDKILTLAKENNEIEVKVWVKLPALYIQGLDLKGYTLGTFEDLETLEELLGKDIESAVHNKTGEIISKVLAQLPDKVAAHLNLKDAAVKLSVRIDALGTDEYPTEHGIYMNMAANLPGIAALVSDLNTNVEKLSSGALSVTIPDDFKTYLDDANYYGAYDVGAIVIAPSLPIPNDGGVQIYNSEDGKAENVFVFERDEKFELKVKYGDKLLGEPQFYYGVTVVPNILTQGVPSEPGLYIVGYEYFDDVTNETTGQSERRRLGSDLAIVIIKQAEADLTIAGKTVTADGHAHLPTISVKDKDGNAVNDAAITVISGTVNSSEATSVADLEANVNIDFPAALDNLWQEFCADKGITAGDTATLREIVDYLKWCKERVNDKVSEALALMEKMGIPTGYVSEELENNVEETINNGVVTLKAYRNAANRYYDMLIEKVESIGGNVLENALDQISVSMKDLDELNYAESGYYLFAGVITDPEYVPEAAAGLLTIRTADPYKMTDTTVCHDGYEHKIELEDVDNNNDDIFVVVNRAAQTVTIHLDNDMTAALKSLLNKAGYKLVNGSNVIVGEAYRKGEAKVAGYIDEFVTALENKIKEKLVSKLAPYYPGDDENLNKAVDEAMERMSSELNAFVADLSARLQDLDQMPDDTKVIINGAYPSLVGEYEFYGYDYDVAKTSATLRIQNHSYVQKVDDKYLESEATCTEPAVYYESCELCGKQGTETFESGDALGHTEGEVVVENKVDPDCVNDGSYDNVVYCTVCDEELSRETITVDALGHSEGEVVVENKVDPDCDTDGSYDNVVYCTVCNEELSRETITVDALGHTEGAVVVENEVDPDCENKGSYDNVVYCTVCGEELSRETVTVDALGHDYDEGVITTAPSCDTEGVKTFTCQNDANHTYTETVPALGHTEGEAVKEKVVEATCKAEGSYDEVVYCSVCSEELSRETKTTEKLPHTEEIIPAVEPTTTTVGWTEGKKCSVWRNPGGTC